MINIVDKSRCSGCFACFNKCPHHAISMKKGEDWHIYPVVEKEKCVDCGLCNDVCLYQNESICQDVLEKPLSFAGYNIDQDDRMQSTSGGIFTIIANYVLDKGGEVCAAKFDEKWSVVHDFATSKEELSVFRKSKYVQSYIAYSFREIELKLHAGKMVLFVGLPCQVAGLKHFLNKNYVNLLTIDLICMGISSPYIWEEYLKEFEGEDIRNITFKDKSIGWWHSDWRTIIEYLDGNKKITKGRENLYMNGYLDRMYYRPSCYNCVMKQRGNYSDFTIGDAWGFENINPSFLDNKGTSVIIINTAKGNEVFGKVKRNMLLEYFPYEKVISYNKYYKTSACPSAKRDKFYRLLKAKGIKVAMIKCCRSDKPIIRLLNIIRGWFLRFK